MALLIIQDASRTSSSRLRLYADACRHLAEADPIMARLIAQVGPCQLKPRRQYFVTFCDSIISQQLSVKVATRIFDRFANLYPRRRPTPRAVLSTSLRRLRTAGLSRQKAQYLRGLAAGFLDGRVATRRFGNQSNDEISATLVMIRGIGRWTADMFLIFALGRLNVLPLGDLGIRKAVQMAYGLSALPTPPKIRTRGRAWHPFETIASWYLWRSLSRSQTRYVDEAVPTVQPGVRLPLARSNRTYS